MHKMTEDNRGNPNGADFDRQFSITTFYSPHLQQILDGFDQFMLWKLYDSILQFA